MYEASAEGVDIFYWLPLTPLCAGRFLLEWMPEFVARGNAVNFVSLLVNFVHYNAAYLDQDVLVGLVQ